MSRPKQLGPYRIEDVLGKGGMGCVYAAADIESGRRVAVKALSPELAVADGFRERFAAEIESLRLLRHEGIVELYGYGEDAGTVFYAMQLVDGSSLEEELRAGRRFNWREVTNIAVQLCRALKHAHDHGVIHRDIKPANILIDRDDRVKLADFGIARLFGSTQLTNAGGVLGTADFMSPEQADGRPVTDRCDQYSLGSVMYALLAGRPPFRAKTLPEMLQLQRYAEPEPVRRYAPRAPEAMERAITQLLAKSPDERFPNTMVLARHLEAMQLALSRPARDDFTLDGSDRELGSATTEADATTYRPDMAMTEADPRGGEAIPESLAEPAGGQAAPADSLAEPREQPTLPAGAAEPIARAHNQADAHPPRSFTAVADEPIADRAESPWRLAAPLGLFVLLLLALGAGAYAAFRPATADELYAAIQAAPEAAWRRRNSTARDDLQAFLKRFPNDPRVDELRPLLKQVVESRLERRLRAATLDDPFDTRLGVGEKLLAAALQLEKRDPVAAAARHREIAKLFAAGDAENYDGPKSDGNKVAIAALALQRVLALEMSIKATRMQHRLLCEERIAAARASAESSPAAATQACEGLIGLYGDEPWADDLVETARTLLAEIETQTNEESGTE